MKLNAIAHSGQRLKDFYDVYFLLEIMPIDDMLKYYQFKYPSSNPLIALKGLTYFDDIDEQVDKPILLKKVTMKQLKKRLQEAVLYTEKIFDPSA